MRRWLAVLVLGLWPVAVWADPPHPPDAAPLAADSLGRTGWASEEEEASYWGVLARLGLGLAVVMFMAWGGVLLLRKSSLGQSLGASTGAIRVAERTYLGPKKAIYLVEIGDRTLALGVTEEHITPLSQWQAGELTLEKADPPASPFAVQLRNLLGHRRGEDQAAGEEGK
jgi:flagellar biogenesis protein FliO